MTGSPLSAHAPSRPTARMLVLVAAVMWSTSGLFANAPILDDWPVGHGGWFPTRGTLLTFWRALFAGLIVLPFARRPCWSWKLVPAVAIFAVMNVTFLSSLTMTSAANAIWLQATAPMWVFLIGVSLLKERATRLDVWLLIFGACGVGLIMSFELGSGQRPAGNTQGVILGLLSGIFFGGVILSLRTLRDFDAAWLIAVNHLVTAALFAPLVVRTGIWPHGGQWVWLILFGGLQMGIPYLLFARGVRTIAGHEASGIALLEPVLVPVWVFLAWNHLPTYRQPQWWTLVGGGFILMGLALRYFGPLIGRTGKER